MYISEEGGNTLKLRQFFISNKRQLLTAVTVLLVFYTFVGAGIFAFFTSRDEVSNSLSARQMSVTLMEPTWDSVGQAMARRSEPGMKIPKNPYAFNDGQTDLYIRLKVTISLDEYHGNLTSDPTLEGEVGVPTNQKRFAAILDALKLKTKDAGNNDIYVPLLDRSAADWVCANSTFVLYPDEVTIPSGNTMDLYFYYTNGDADNKLSAVAPDGSTEELFHRLEVPIYKKDYLGVFDQGYDIKVQAQALPVRSIVQQADPVIFESAWN